VVYTAADYYPRLQTESIGNGQPIGAVDLGCVYWGQAIRMERHQTGVILTFKLLPDVRYFDITTYDTAGFTLGNIADVDLVPSYDRQGNTIYEVEVTNYPDQATKLNVVAPLSAPNGQGLMSLRYYLPQGTARGGGEKGHHSAGDTLPSMAKTFRRGRNERMRDCRLPFTGLHTPLRYILDQLTALEDLSVPYPESPSVQNRFVTLEMVNQTRDSVILTGPNDYYMIALLNHTTATGCNTSAGLVAVITAPQAPVQPQMVRYWSMTVADYDNITGNVFPTWGTAVPPETPAEAANFYSNPNEMVKWLNVDYAPEPPGSPAFTFVTGTEQPSDLHNATFINFGWSSRPFINYRQAFASPDFPGLNQWYELPDRDVGNPVNPTIEEFMGDYYPTVKWCSVAEYSSLGNECSPASCIA